MAVFLTRLPGPRERKAPAPSPVGAPRRPWPTGSWSWSLSNGRLRAPPGSSESLAAGLPAPCLCTHYSLVTDTNNTATGEARCGVTHQTGGERAWNDVAGRSKIFHSNWKGNADAMLTGLDSPPVTVPLPGHPAVHPHCRLLKVTQRSELWGRDLRLWKQSQSLSTLCNLLTGLWTPVF